MAVARAGFDDSEFYDLFARERSTWHMPVVAHRIDGADEPMDAVERACRRLLEHPLTRAGNRLTGQRGVLPLGRLHSR